MRTYEALWRPYGHMRLGLVFDRALMCRAVLHGVSITPHATSCYQHKLYVTLNTRRKNLIHSGGSLEGLGLSFFGVVLVSSWKGEPPLLSSALQAWTFKLTLTVPTVQTPTCQTFP